MTAHCLILAIAGAGVDLPERPLPVLLLGAGMSHEQWP